MQQMILMYFSVVLARHERILNRFHINCLKKILHITWKDKIPDTEILERTGLPCVQIELSKNRIRWAGHVKRMPDHRIPKQLLYCQLREGKRSRGRPKKRFKDCLKDSLKDFGMNTDSWEEDAEDRATWRGLIRNGAMKFESNRAEEAKRKRAIRKGRENLPEVAAPPTSCPHCIRAAKANVGLVCRTHSVQP